jgi:hypothetical protein
VNTKLKRLILLALLRCDGVPMPEDSLVGAVQVMARPDRPTAADVGIALKDVESSGYVSGLSEDLVGTSWTLTEKGKHKAAQL